jgi:hypothetical protein
MAAGTPTDTDSYFLSQSPVFQHRVQTAVIVYMEVVESEIPTGVTGTMPDVVHQARMNFVKSVMSPSSFTTWMTQFVQAAASDANVVSAATNATVTYTPITSSSIGDTAAAEGGLVTTTLISNAVAASFNTFVPGI